MTAQSVRQAVLDWLDDNYHFGDAERLIGDDDSSFLKNGILDSLGFVKLVLHLEDRFKIRIAVKELTPKNFDSLNLIVRYVTNHRDYPKP
jgi:acyl carrier protein